MGIFSNIFNKPTPDKLLRLLNKSPEMDWELERQIKDMFQRGLDPNAPAGDGTLPLGYIISRSIMLRKRHGDKDGRLHDAWWYNNEDACTLAYWLFEAGARIGELQSLPEGETYATWAAANSATNACTTDARVTDGYFLRIAVNQAADLDERNAAGDAPIHIATRVGLIQNIQILKAAGVNIHAKNANGETAKDIATAELSKLSSVRIPKGGRGHAIVVQRHNNKVALYQAIVDTLQGPAQQKPPPNHQRVEL